MTDNAIDPAQVKKRNRKAKDQETQDTADLLAILGTEHGRRFLWAELARCRVFMTAFHVEQLVFAHNEGRRSAGVELMARIIETDPQAWIVMQQEAARSDLQ